MPKSKPRAKDQASKAKITQAQWWKATAQNRKPHELLDALVKQIAEDQSSRYDAYREYARAYGADLGAFGDDNTMSNVYGEELKQNEMANTIETLHAQIFKNKVVPGISTSEADWEEYERAKGFARWIEGWFTDAKIFSDAVPTAGMDSIVFGTGFIKVTSDRDYAKKTASITAERVCPRYIYIDRHEAKHGKPRSIFQKHHIDRWVLHDKYVDEADGDTGLYGDIEFRSACIQEVASNTDDDFDQSSLTKGDMVTVWEAWHLPSRPGAKDGRRCVWIQGCTLIDEPWERDRFPFTSIKFGTVLAGVYGDSAVRRLNPSQKAYDKLNQKIDDAIDIMAVPRVIMRKGTGITAADMNDIPGSILEVEGDPNTCIREWNAVPMGSDVFNERTGMPQRMRGLIGVSQMDAQQSLPQGMRDVSGAFLERWSESGNARHAMFHGQYEAAMVDLADLAIDEAESCENDKLEVIVKAKGAEIKNTIELLSFKDVGIDRKRMTLYIQPMSQLPQSFAGKVEALKTLGDVPKEYLRLVEVPDFNKESDLEVSDEDIIRKQIHFMIKNGEQLFPLPFDNLGLVISLTTKFINLYRVRSDADDTKIGLLANYIEEAQALAKGLGSGGPELAPAGSPPPVDPMQMQAGPGPVTGQPMPMDPGMMAPPQGMPPQ